MNVFVIESSPHKSGSSNTLADSFIRGAREAGHDVTVFDAGHANLHPCLGCNHCGMAGPCVQHDDMAAVRAGVLDANLVAFVTPLYYFGVSAQLKTVIDRFYAFNGELSSGRLKTVLIAAAWDSNEWTMAALRDYYQTLCRYLNFNDCGMILGTGCGTVPMTQRSPFVQKAYELGKSLA